uniref:Potassium channel toxin alpha-KTx 11.2 n=1 Tax=Parabuthus villosus TaxID=252780 RepID=KA112_PARVI|nr:RecName: Full=Potassium channel toxin alpha-KTx 11.2; AltName: Full=Parabutoxin-2; Short=PBTx2 [Parabuthus villosus]pir/A59487/ parabutoxin 2 - Parabuthus villosus [Parabuthus villosus]
DEEPKETCSDEMCVIYCKGEEYSTGVCDGPQKCKCSD